MTQPSAYPPAASFRPASGWQFDGAPQRASTRPTSPSVPVAAIVLASLGLVLHGAQGIATVAPLVDLDIVSVARILAIWLPTMTLIALGIATSARSLVMTIALSATTLVVTILVVVFAGVGTIAWWEMLAVVPLVVALIGGVLSWSGLASDRAAAATTGWIVVLSAVVLHALLVVVGPVASSAVASLGPYLLNAVPVQVLGVAAIVATAVSRRTGLGTMIVGVAFVLLAAGLVLGPLVSTATSVEPNVGVLVVAIVRFLLVAGAGVLVLLAPRR